jgi:lysophospholipase L1-like esterase
MLDRGTFLKLAATVPILPGSMMFATPRILVLGDSVTWGQGLNANQKMQKQLAAMFYYQNGVEPQILSYARGRHYRLRRWRSHQARNRSRLVATRDSKSKPYDTRTVLTR